MEISIFVVKERTVYQTKNKKIVHAIYTYVQSGSTPTLIQMILLKLHKKKKNQSNIYN